MKKLTCIVCPIGCALTAENSGLPDIFVTGNLCPRGATYAQEEIRAPKRIVTATCKVEGAQGSIKRVPVKTTSPCPREKIPALLEDIYKMEISIPVKTGDVLIANWKGENISVVAARTLS